MLLKNKNAIIYGAGGSLGSTIAKAFAEAGAKVFLTGRNLASVNKVLNEIVAAGGIAEAAQVDALDEQAVNDHVNVVVHNAGTVDISFNLIDTQAIQGIPLTEMTVADFTRPTNIAMQTQFITSTAAARVMIKQQSGVILSLTATPGGVAYPGVGGFGPACCAIEGFFRNLASENGPYGVRVVNIRSGGSPDSNVFKEAISANPEEMEIVLRKMKADTMLKEMPAMADVANTAVFLASPLAGKITGVTIDLTCGTTVGLNYRTSDSMEHVIKGNAKK
ncbi:SDR family NAD(P)-dependent oxidoreductase [Mucilaginibacter agri]|uniref:SDR family oxidoreductase n=1 Tax=Mucilaginibacter agri TaxID=2695265 RepID=A0A965ZLF2_9SPHI|nr:SDR family oxidoreductase [Mucilaginibacter agri]NCD71851.1 SDR family oxidoreductase [Mucilaginibacter agri]